MSAHYPTSCGTPEPARGYRLTAPDVARIRAQIRVGRSDQDIAEQFGVTPMTVYSIRTRRTWSTA